MNKQAERAALKAAYPHSLGWAARVDKMSPQQVTAVYLKFKSEGKIK